MEGIWGDERAHSHRGNRSQAPDPSLLEGQVPGGAAEGTKVLANG